MVTDSDFPEVDDEFLQRLLAEICCGPIGAAMMAVAKGERQVVIKQHPSRSGWVVSTEAVTPSAFCAPGGHVFDQMTGQCAHCAAKYAPGIGVYVL